MGRCGFVWIEGAGLVCWGGCVLVWGGGGGCMLCVLFFIRMLFQVASTGI